MNIGEAIASLRKYKNISQKELAQTSGLSQAHISLIENNNQEPNLRTLKTISQSLDVPLPFLLLFSVDKDDVAEAKRDSFEKVIPLLKALVGEFVKA